MASIEPEQSEEDEQLEESPAAGKAHRRTPEEMDALRARLIREGFPLTGLSERENIRIWVTITQKRRYAQMKRLLRVNDAAIDERIVCIRQQVFAATGRR